ncbi:hypothetical protein [Bradyrhizobium lablabi]|uniref:hypothetical protein n=1 Tax=Bradyrhizobium lablabi TaxID=722472 RepID=UPI001BA98D3D|nr:hypothetical protein [Bradyrhizobium lablabi]MBR0697849.1 hypothetical protein [Bradyrhizobium lablabi]
MPMDSLIVVALVCLIFSSFALVLALVDRSTTRWQREQQNQDQASTRASYPPEKAA